MIEPDPTTDAEGDTTVANVSDPPPEDKGSMCDTENKEGKAKIDVDNKMEAKGKKDIDGKEEDEDKKAVNQKEVIIEEDGQKKEEGEVQEDGDGMKERELQDGEENKGGQVQDGYEKKEGEGKESADEKEVHKGVKDIEKVEDGPKNVIAKDENMEEAKQDNENVNTAEVEDVKMVDAEHVKADDAVDVKMVDKEDLKDEKGGRIGDQEGEHKSHLNEEGDGGTTEEKVDADKEAEGSKRKRPRTKRASQKGEGKDKKDEIKVKELLRSPVSSIERPVRERKTVERLVEVIEKESNREFQVEKGRGTPLKDIPNVAYKLSRKKPADIKLIHQTLFGRKGKAVNFRSHILQFSGFVWHESDEKQRAKMKEKLDKYVKDTLLDLCVLFNLPVSRANTRKEDLVAKLLDFLVAPHPTTDVMLAEKDQKSRKRKRMARGSTLKSWGGMPTKHSRKKRTKSGDTPTAKESSAQETEDDDDEEEDDKENSLSEEEKVHKHAEDEAKDTESGEAADEDKDDVDEDDEKKLGKGKQDKKQDQKKAIKQRVAVEKEKLKVVTSLKKSVLPTPTKSPLKRSSNRSNEEDNNAYTKVFTSRKKNLDFPKKKSTSKSNTMEKSTDKKMPRSKTKPEVEQPSKEDLRKKICEILKEVDFNTATFTDILKQLAAYYKTDLTPRKASLKIMIQEELTRLTEEAEEDEGGEDEDDDAAEKEEKPEPNGKEVET